MKVIIPQIISVIHAKATWQLPRFSQSGHFNIYFRNFFLALFNYRQILSLLFKHLQLPLSSFQLMSLLHDFVLFGTNRGDFQVVLFDLTRAQLIINAYSFIPIEINNLHPCTRAYTHNYRT